MKIAVIGVGNRGFMYAKHFMHAGVEIVSICDKNPSILQDSVKKLKVAQEKAFLDENEFFAQGKIADALIIATQDRDHYGHAKKALEIGYHLLCEKPVSPIKEQCAELNNLAKEKGLYMVICHVLRYTKFYSSIKDIIDSGIIGKVTNINLVENIGYWHFAHSYVRGNWRREDETGPSILAKCCHDLDMIYFLSGQKAKSVYSVGSRKEFLPENAPEGATNYCTEGCPHFKTCPYEPRKLYYAITRHTIPKMITNRRLITGKSGSSVKELIEALKTSPYGRCVYKCDNDVIENQVVSLKLNGDINATLTMTAQTNNCYRHTRICGTKGEIIGQSSSFVVNVFAGKKLHYRFGLLEAIGHVSGDFNIVKDFINLIDKGIKTSKLSLMEQTMESHMVAFAADESRKTGKVVQMPEY